MLQVAIDSKKRAFSWGFGGFGRLGHAEQKDESVPRLIKYFDTSSRGVRSVYCGATYSLAVNENGGRLLCCLLLCWSLLVMVLLTNWYWGVYWLRCCFNAGIE